jgi:hypothetical protein
MYAILLSGVPGDKKRPKKPLSGFFEPPDFRSTFISYNLDMFNIL